MLSKKEIGNIIEKIVIILNREYLAKYPHDVVSEQELKQGFDTRWRKKHREYKDYIDCGDGNFIALTKELEHREVKLTLKRMKNVYMIRNELLSMLRVLVKEEFTPPVSKPKDDLTYANEKIMEIRYQLELGRVNNTILSLEHEKEHLKSGEGCDGKFWMTRSSAEGAFANGLSFLNEWIPKSQPLPQTPQTLPPPAYNSQFNAPSEIATECKQMESLPDKAVNESYHNPVDGIPAQEKLPVRESVYYPSGPTLFTPNRINPTDERSKPSAPVLADAFLLT